MIRAFILLLTCNLVLSSTFAQKKEEKLVRESFEKYKSAILNDRGEEAVNYVDNRTINYYRSMLESTKAADSAAVEKLDLMDKLMVFSIRHRASKADIKSFDARKLFIYAIKAGMVGKGSVARNSIGKVNIEGDFAEGKLVVDGQETPVGFHFYKEDEAWKIDLTSIFTLGRAAFTKMQEESGLGENEFIFSILEKLTGKQPGAEIWDTIE